MKNVIIYTKDNCVWCVRAKEIMKNLHISYEEKKFNVDYTKDDLVKGIINEIFGLIQ